MDGHPSSAPHFHAPDFPASRAAVDNLRRRRSSCGGRSRPGTSRPTIKETLAAPRNDVINLMDALRASIAADKPKTRAKRAGPARQEREETPIRSIGGF